MVFYFRFEERIMLSDAGAAIRESILGYLVAFCGPCPVARVAGVAITGLTALAEFSGFPG